MPQNYKKAASKYGTFEEQNMEKAIEAVNSGEMNNSQAANMYSVHRTTLLILSFFGPSKKHWR